MSCSVLFAVKKAAEAARKEIDNKDSFVLCESGYNQTYCIPMHYLWLSKCMVNHALDLLNHCINKKILI